MKITIIKELEVTNPSLNMTMILGEKDKPSLHISLEFTCPECGGHGCRNPSSELRCDGGAVCRTIEATKLSKWLDDPALTKVRIAVAELHNALNGSTYQAR